MVPECDGRISKTIDKDALWDKSFAAAPRPLTPWERQYSDRKLGWPAAAEITAALEKGEPFRVHAFERACAKAGDRSSPDQAQPSLDQWPWTSGQAERMNPTIKEATVRRSYYDSHGASD